MSSDRQEVGEREDVSVLTPNTLDMSRDTSGDLLSSRLVYIDRLTTELADLRTDLRAALSDVTDVIRVQNEVTNA